MLSQICRRIDEILKRIVDFVVAVFGMLLMFPAMAIIAILIKWNSPGPVFYRGRRSARHGGVFYIFKFRTMVVDAERVGGPSTAMNDPRLTRIGKILRKYKLDELPQLFNIIRGEMSFVGPRPQVEKYTKLYEGVNKKILSVRPGVTDYASIEYIHLDRMLGDEDVDKKYLAEIEPGKNKLRLKYALHRSLWVDFKILILTVVRMMKIRRLWNISN